MRGNLSLADPDYGPRTGIAAVNYCIPGLCDLGYKTAAEGLVTCMSKISKMTKNVGNTDKIFRIILAAAAGLLFFTHVVTGTGGIILVVAGGILLVTSLLGFCPIYALLGMNSCPRKA